MSTCENWVLKNFPPLASLGTGTAINALAVLIFNCYFNFFIFSERELAFTFAICYRPSVCRLSVTLVRPTQAVEIFGNIFTALGTLAIH